MTIISDVKKLHFQKIDLSLRLNKGLNKVLGIKANKMSRFEAMDRLIEKLHFLRLHNVLSQKNYRIPLSWQKLLDYHADFADESDLLDLICSNTI